MVSLVPASANFRRGSLSWSSRPAGSVRAQKCHGLRLARQINEIRFQRLTPTKRKRASFFAYDSSSDTDNEEPSRLEQTAHTRRYAKRVRRAEQESEAAEDVEELLDSAELDEGGGAPGDDRGEQLSSNADEPFFDLEHDDELTAEYARSAEPLQEVDLSDIYDYGRRSPEDEIASEEDTSSDETDNLVEFRDRPEVKKYLNALPQLLSRRFRRAVLSRRASFREIDDETLCVKLLSRRLKTRLNAGRLTDTQIVEVMSQRPLYSTYGDLRIPTPELLSDTEDEFGSCDLTDLEFEESSVPERPSTPLPPSDSDSDSDSEDDGPAVYSSSEISRQLNRREMESMGICP